MAAPRCRPGLQVQIGDVIYIEANSGSVKRVGRCDAYSTEFDLEVRNAQLSVPCNVSSTHAAVLRRRSMCPCPGAMSTSGRKLCRM